MSNKVSARLKEYIKKILRDRELLIGAGEWEMVGKNYFKWGYFVNGNLIEEVNLNVTIIDDVYTYIDNDSDDRGYCYEIKFDMESNRYRVFRIHKTRDNTEFVDRLKKGLQKNANV